MEKNEGSLNPYTILGVARDATAAEIRKAYRRLAPTCHPDAHPEDSTAPERFRLITEAYEILCDASKRKLFDETGDMSRAMKPRESEVVLQQVFDAVLAQMSSPADDVVDLARRRVKSDLQKLRNALEMAKRGLDLLRASEKHVTYKGTGRNILELVYASKINANEQAIAQSEAAIVIGCEMLELLKDYDSGVKQLPAVLPNFVVPNFSQTSIFSGWTTS